MEHKELWTNFINKAKESSKNKKEQPKKELPEELKIRLQKLKDKLKEAAKCKEGKFVK